MDKTNRAQNLGKVPVRARDKTHFWNWDNDEETGVRTLCLDGTIADESWWGDEITPRMFRDELFSGSGDLVVWINSPGGDCVAASQIYTMLMDYTGNVTVKIDGLAASAASVIAMAGTEVLMAPTALLMIHNPLTVAIGDTEEMQKAIAMLDEVKESIINAYEIKTGQSRAKISHLMDGETWMNANKAIELGFVDGILTDTKRGHTEDVVFILGGVTVNDDIITVVSTEYLSTWAVLKEYLLDIYGGYLVVTFDSNENPMLSYLASPPDTATQRIEFGENLSELSVIRNADETYTACIPLGATLKEIDENVDSDERLTIEDANGGMDYIVDTANAEIYGVIFAPVALTTFEEEKNATYLLQRGQAWLSNAGVRLKECIALSAVDLHHVNANVEAFSFLDRIIVSCGAVCPESEFVLTGLEIPLNDPASMSITLGDSKPSLISDGAKQNASAVGRLESIEAEQVANHSIYVWGAQGQQGAAITETWIRKRETTDKNADRAIAFWKKQCAAGYASVIRAFDCSGLGVCFLLENGLIKSDMNANGIMGKCDKITKDKLRIGDFVFKTNSSGRATHIGYIADNDLNVIEAKGRDYGVTKSKLSDWSVYGRPPYWTEAEVMELQGAEPVAEQPQQSFLFTRVLKSGVRGEDVCELKRLLAAAGFGGLTLGNKNYYNKTKNTVKAFQKANGLVPDGKAGPLTIAALGGVWKTE